MKKRKIKFLLNRTAVAVEFINNGLQVTLQPFISGDPKPDEGVKSETIEVEKMLVCVGRQPNTSNIGLEDLGVAKDPRGWIPTDESLETSLHALGRGLHS